MKINYSLPGRAKTCLTLLSTATFLAATPLARADSPSETLEKAIYSEETKGDLDNAMSLYKQVIEQAKTSQALAAQAEYRLGVCQYKKQDFTAASATFSAVLKDYPDQKDIAALARDYLARNTDLVAAPWVDGEEERFDVRLAGGLKVGFGVWTANAVETNGQKIWRVGRLMTAGGQQVSSVEVDAASMKPLHSYWKHQLLGAAEVTYLPDHAEVKQIGKGEARKVPLTGVVYDNEEAFYLFRRLPLTPAYKANITLLPGLGGGNLIPMKVEVTATENVTVPAGTFPCYKLDLNIGQVFWISTNDSHEVVKIEAGGAVMELAGSRKRTATDVVNYDDPSGFSLTAPAGWVIGSLLEEKNRSVLGLLDPGAVGDWNLEWLTPTTDDAKSATNTARTVMEKDMADAAKAYENFQVRAGSWQERTMAGQPAVSVLADYTDNDRPQVSYAITTLVPGHTVSLVLRAPAKEFDALRAKFDAMVDSIKVK